MADILYSLSLRVDKDNFANQVAVTNVQVTQAKAGYSSQVYDLSSSPVPISTSSLSTVGIGFLRNLSTSSSSTAQIGIEAGGSFVGFSTLKAGEPAIFRLASGTDYVAVGTAGTRLRVDIAEG